MQKREKLLNEISDILELENDTLSLNRIIEYTQFSKRKSFFEKAILKENIPYGVFNDSEEILIYQSRKSPEFTDHQKEYFELIVSNVNKLIELRDKQYNEDM